MIARELEWESRYAAKQLVGDIHRVGAGDVAQPFCTRLDRTRLSRPIHRYQAEGWAVAGVPFKVVQQRPVEVAADVDAVADTSRDAIQRAADVLDAAIVLVGADSVLGDDDRNFGDCAGLADVRFERFGPEFVTHQRGLDAGFRAQRAVGADAVARVSLNADEIVAARCFVENVLAFGLDQIATLFAAGHGLE